MTSPDITAEWESDTPVIHLDLSGKGNGPEVPFRLWEGCPLFPVGYLNGHGKHPFRRIRADRVPAYIRVFRSEDGQLIPCRWGKFDLGTFDREIIERRWGNGQYVVRLLANASGNNERLLQRTLYITDAPGQYQFPGEDWAVGTLSHEMPDSEEDECPDSEDLFFAERVDVVREMIGTLVGAAAGILDAIRHRLGDEAGSFDFAPVRAHIAEGCSFAHEVLASIARLHGAAEAAEATDLIGVASTARTRVKEIGAVLDALARTASAESGFHEPPSIAVCSGMARKLSAALHSLRVTGEVLEQATAAVELADARSFTEAMRRLGEAHENCLGSRPGCLARERTTFSGDLFSCWVEAVQEIRDRAGAAARTEDGMGPIPRAAILCIRDCAERFLAVLVKGQGSGCTLSSADGCEAIHLGSALEKSLASFDTALAHATERLAGPDFKDLAGRFSVFAVRFDDLITGLAMGPVVYSRAKYSTPPEALHPLLREAGALWAATEQMAYLCKGARERDLLAWCAGGTGQALRFLDALYLDGYIDGDAGNNRMPGPRDAAKQHVHALWKMAEQLSEAAKERGQLADATRPETRSHRETGQPERLPSRAAQAQAPATDSRVLSPGPTAEQLAGQVRARAFGLRVQELCRGWVGALGKPHREWDGLREETRAVRDEALALSEQAGHACASLILLCRVLTDAMTMSMSEHPGDFLHLVTTFNTTIPRVIDPFFDGRVELPEVARPEAAPGTAPGAAQPEAAGGDIPVVRPAAEVLPGLRDYLVPSVAHEAFLPTLTVSVDLPEEPTPPEVALETLSVQLRDGRTMRLDRGSGSLRIVASEAVPPAAPAAATPPPLPARVMAEARSVASESLRRSLARRLTRVLSATVLTVASEVLGPRKRADLATLRGFLEGPVGRSLLQSVGSLAVEGLPLGEKLADLQRAAAHELRVEALAGLGDAFMDRLGSGVLAALHAAQESGAFDAEEETADLQEHVPVQVDSEGAEVPADARRSFGTALP
jgi:hypothetical protein